MTSVITTCSGPDNSYSAALISDQCEILKLARWTDHFAAVPEMCSPQVFLASVLAGTWRPWVVAVSRRGRLAGLLYCKERLIGGVGTGIVFGDDAHGMMLASSPEESVAVISCAFKTLATRMRAIRFVLRPEHAIALESSQIGADVKVRSTTPHAHLQMPETYEGFLGKVGSRTRRNLRYYRRKSESAGHIFSPELQPQYFRSAAHQLRPSAAFTQSIPRLEKYLAMIEAMPTHVLTGLKDRTGAWISLLGGWGVGRRAYIILQLNDRTHARDSVSMVMRSYLLELLIGQGYREVVFVGGTVPPLSSYCEFPECSLVYADRPSPGWRLARFAVSTFAAAAPEWLASRLAYIVPAYAATSTCAGASASSMSDL